MALVVLYHAGIPGLPGGFVGVDVFFVISGFVITGLLLRERTSTGRTSILDFYARRCRRILPAATLVLLVTVFASYFVLGVVSADTTADDGRWAAAFLANFHFEWVGTNYFTAQRPPSPFQNYWSLSVEEQFYVVYPTIFLVLARAKSRLSLRVLMAVALTAVVIASYCLSILQTAAHPTSAYFSPFARAWELALGALVAIATIWLKRIPARVAALATWAGLAAIAFSAVAFNARTAYPGSLVALPVVGAGLVIAGGTASPRSGAESLLTFGPFQWLGKRSYSLYLWHWPILILAAERIGKTSLPIGDNLALIVLALALSMMTYRMVENPVRHWRLPSKQSVFAGAGIALSTVAVLSLLISLGAASPVPQGGVGPVSDTRALLKEVASATSIKTVPRAVARAEFGAAYRQGYTFESPKCQAKYPSTSEQICTLGDPNGRHLAVLYGDSHALMWIPAMTAIAKAEHWRLVVLGRFLCPAARVTIAGQAFVGEPPGPDLTCNKWQMWATNWINHHKPNILVISQLDRYPTPGARGGLAVAITSTQWRKGLDALFHSFHVPHMRTVLLGTTPFLTQRGPVCLAAHPRNVQACSSSARSAVSPLSKVDRDTALADHVAYVDTTPWFCTKRCSPIIGKYEVYDDGGHIDAVWASYLQDVLGKVLFRST